MVDSSAWFTCYQPRPEAKLRVIGFPHGGGGPQAFYRWAQLLPTTIELLALQLPGRGSRLDEPTITAMDALTPHIIKALGAYFDKPFVFFGHSVGALVAFETARQLELTGHPVPLHLFASAHLAPNRAPNEPLMYQYSDAALLDLIGELGLVPDAVAEHPELLSLILPPLKADFALSETYDWQQTSPIALPLTVLGGQHDPLVAAADLQQWQALTTNTFDLALFEGDHFYTESHQEAVVTFLTQRIDETVAALPPSLMFGERLPYPEQCLHELLREQAAKTPDALALSGETLQLTFRELDEQSDLLARYLQSQGVRVNTLVGIYMETSVEYVIAFFAALKAGGGYMTVEIAYPEALLQQALTSAQPVVLLTKERFSSHLTTEWQGRAFNMNPSWVAQLSAQQIDVPAALPLPTIDSLAQCVMSSGTTGTPKGIICPHRSAVNSYYWRYHYHPYQPGEREACNVFLVWEVARPLLQGYPAYIIPNEIIYDPARLVDYLSKHRITRILFTPSLLEQILNTPNLDLPTKLRHVRVVYLNGEVVTTRLRNRFQELFPDVTLLNDYSTAEAHDTTHLDLAQLDPLHSPKYAPIGRPMSNVNLYVLDENQQPVPQGFRGELYIGGESMGHGYLNQPEKTAERFVHDPFVDTGAWMFRTGDAGRILPNGQLEIQGRIAFMVKLRGYTVVPSAVETVIIQYPGINTAVVVTQNNVETNQPEHLIAYVVGHQRLDGRTLDALRSYLRQQLPHYAIPSFIIPLDELPIAANGKLDRRQLPAPDQVQLATPTKTLVAPPQTATEKTLAAIWQETLTVDGVNLTDNFFDRGGHSLLAAALCSQVRETLHVALSVVDVFQYPTFGDLAHFLADQADLSAAQRAGEPAVVRTELVRQPLATEPEIAVIGMAGRFPGAENLDLFWENLRAGLCSIRHFTDEELATVGIPPEVYQRADYVKAGAMIEGVDQFDPDFWGLSRREATVMDPQQRLFLESCWHALESAGYPPTQNGDRTGVFAGTFLPLYLLHYLHGGGLMDPTDAPYASLTEFGNDKDYLATRVSYLLNLRGPSISVQTSCSTGLVAIATACQALLAGQCDMALAGAASITFPQGGYQYVEGYLNARDGVCRAFDAEAGGTILGDGVGVVVLKRLADAKAANDNILAVIKGYAINNDGNAKASYTAPSVQGQAAVVASAQAMAGVAPETISYIEAHGTGTLIGDPIEVRALSTVFQQSTDRTGFCALGSIKPNIGHSNIAAGVAGFMKTVLALHHRQLPPTINFKTPNPALQLERTPFYVNDQLRDWQAPSGEPRRAGVTSLGIGGTNCHIVLEEAAATVPASPEDVGAPQLLTLSAKSAASLAQNRDNLIDYLQANPTVKLADVAYTLQVGRVAFDHRLTVAACTVPDAVHALHTVPELAQALHTVPEPAQALHTVDKRAPTRRVKQQPAIVFMFSGQGAQYLRMGAGLYHQLPRFRHHFDECNRYLQPLLGRDLYELLYGEDQSAEQLHVATVLQPALFTVEYALARTLMAWGIQPMALVGHSLGEYVAACLAGVLSLEDALMLVVTRAAAMQTAGAGAMLAVKLSPAAVKPYLTDLDLHIAVLNGPANIVLSGACAAIAQIEATLKAADVVCMPVNVTHAFHSPLLADAAATLQQKAPLVACNRPTIPLTANLTGGWLTDQQALDAGYWAAQMQQPVRFAENIETVLQEHPAILLEVGPGHSLSRAAMEIVAYVALPDAPQILSTMRHPHNGVDDLVFLLQTVGHLWSAGLAIDWDAVGAGQARRRIPLPTYAFANVRCWPEEAVIAMNRPSQLAHQSQGKQPLDEWFYMPTFSQTLPLPPHRAAAHPAADHPAAERWLLFLEDATIGNAHGENAEQAALGAELATALERAGHEVLRVYRAPDQAVELLPPLNGIPTWTIRPTSEAYLALLNQLAATGQYPQRMLYLWGLSTHGAAAAQDPADDLPYASFPEKVCITSPAEPMGQIFSGGLYSQFAALAKALSCAANPAPLHLWLVTNRTVQVDQEAIEPAKATLLGPALVLPQENPQIACRVLDIQLPADQGRMALDKIADQILAECTATVPSGEALVAHRGYKRWVPRYEPVSLPADQMRATPSIRPNGVYLITGGLGRIGLTLAKHLALYQCQIILTTRTQFPPKEEWSTLLAISETEAEARPIIEQLRAIEATGAAGAKVAVVQMEMSNGKEVERTLLQVAEQFGTIDGIFHAAGVADLRYLPELTAAIAQREFAPKIDGVYHLDRAIAKVDQVYGIKPNFVMLFSSIAAVLGGLAMSAYAAANRFMDAFVQENPQRQGVRWLSCNWDDWDFTYDQEQTAAYEQSQARAAAMQDHEGLAVIERVLAQLPTGQLVISTRPFAPRWAQWVTQRNTPPVAMYEGGAEQQESTGNGSSPQNGQYLGNGQYLRYGQQPGNGQHALDRSTHTHTPASRQAEQILAIYREVLGVRTLSAHDNFFALGGDSLLATQIWLKLRQTMPSESNIALRDIFDQPMIGDLVVKLSG